MKLIHIIIISLIFTGCTVIKKDNVKNYKENYTSKKVIPKIEKYSKYGNPKTYKVFGVKYKTLQTHVGYSEKGIASWYGKKFHGKLTSTREVYNMYNITAAHKSLPIPCYAKVTNLSNNKSLIVRINDRGPFKKGRIIDLSYAAAKKLDFIKQGTARVLVEAIDVKKNNY
jgi:rare lipoprotein A